MTDLERLNHTITRLLVIQEAIIGAVDKLAAAVETNNEMIRRLIDAAHDDGRNGHRG